MLLMEIKVGDLLHFDYFEDVGGMELVSRTVLVLDVIPIPAEHGGPNVSVLDNGMERHLRNSQLWPIEELGG